MVAWFRAWLLLVPIPIGKAFAKDFLWLSQGQECPQWLFDVSEQPNSYLLMGIYGRCAKHDFTEKRRFYCLESDTDVVKGRMLLFARGDEWEKQRGVRFHYFIWSDDNGQFDFMPSNQCTPEFCGDASLLPLPNEKATMYWQRLLEEDQPAVASPIIHDRDCMMSTDSMYICTTNMDGKLMAFHWSARKMLAIYVEEFAPISCNIPLTNVIVELMESAFRGYTWTYRIFERTGNHTRFTEHRATYVRNIHPSFPRPLEDGSWGDSQVNYSAFLPCLPWASLGSEDFCVEKPVGKGLNKWHEKKLKHVMPGMLGYGFPHLPNVTNTSADRLCRLGLRNVDTLIRWFHYPRKSRGNKELRKALSSEDFNHCFYPCTAMIIGAGVLAARSVGSLNSMLELKDSCRFNFLRAWSMLDLLGGGFVSLFELVLRETLHRASEPPGSLDTLPQIRTKLSQISPADWKEISNGADDANWICDVQKSVKLLLQGVEDETWRSGSVHAASLLLFNCQYETLLHPRLAPLWALVVQLGRMGVQAHLPPSHCELQNRHRFFRFCLLFLAFLSQIKAQEL